MKYLWDFSDSVCWTGHKNSTALELNSRIFPQLPVKHQLLRWRFTSMIPFYWYSHIISTHILQHWSLCKSFHMKYNSAFQVYFDCKNIFFSILFGLWLQRGKTMYNERGLKQKISRNNYCSMSEKNKIRVFNLNDPQQWGTNTTKLSQFPSCQGFKLTSAAEWTL